MSPLINSLKELQAQHENWRLQLAKFQVECTLRILIKIIVNSFYSKSLKSIHRISMQDIESGVVIVITTNKNEEEGFGAPSFGSFVSVRILFNLTCSFITFRVVSTEALQLSFNCALCWLLHLEILFQSKYVESYLFDSPTLLDCWRNQRFGPSCLERNPFT